MAITKRLFITPLLASISLLAFSQDKMIVHLKDGSTALYEMSAIDYVELQPDSQTLNPPSADIVNIVGGTVGSAIDLGLSVMWADHNLGSLASSDPGCHCSWADATGNVQQWGNEWRLPTDEEWNELYERCTWTWTIRDGIGGRLVTGPSGNSIFLPAAGISIEGTSHVIGSLGIYWSAAISEEEGSNAVGSFFDSANIYRMDFPRTNKFTVRPVK